MSNTNLQEVEITGETATRLLLLAVVLAVGAIALLFPFGLD
jgi:hypothetical protein